MGWIQSIFRPNKTADETVTADTEAVVNCEKTPNAPACQEGANPGATEDPTSVIMGWNRVLAGRDANPESEFDHEEPNKTTRAERLAAKRRAQDAIDPCLLYTSDAADES